MLTRGKPSRKVIKPSRILALTSTNGVPKASEISRSVIAAKNASSRVLLCGCESKLSAASTRTRSPFWIIASPFHGPVSSAPPGTSSSEHCGGRLSVDRRKRRSSAVERAAKSAHEYKLLPLLESKAKGWFQIHAKAFSKASSASLRSRRIHHVIAKRERAYRSKKIANPAPSPTRRRWIQYASTMSPVEWLASASITYGGVGNVSYNWMTFRLHLREPSECEGVVRRA